MALFGSLSTVRAQAPKTPGFATAFAYVEELLRPGSPVQARLHGIARGESQKVDLGGGVFVMEQVYETKPRAEGFFESHRKYIDVQVVAEGEELMEVIDASRITVREPYAADRDLILYAEGTDASLLRAVAGQVAVFFPVDVHMPSLRLRTAPSLVRKAVVKIPVA
jgi:YhcH/YjgK/YiaL family protein